MKYVAVSLLVAASAHAQLSPDEALKSFVLADSEMTMELVAAEPLVESPCALAFDEQGRMFVAENRGYPNTSNPPQGRIAMLTDDDGDGRMDRRTTFADGLEYPNGVLPWKDGVYVTAAPDVLFLRDTNGDGVADERRVVLTGFDTKKSTQLRMNKPLPGPDGWIYLASGLTGGRITNPDRADLPPLDLKTDLRFRPETGEYEAVDGRSQYGHDFDAWGNRFICMNRVPVQHVVLSSRILRRNPNLAFSDTVQDCSAADVQSVLRGDRAGVRLFPISQNITTADAHAGSFSAACAVTFWRGQVFSCDPTANLVHVDRLEPRGSTFAAVPVYAGMEFLASRDDWFRPVYLARGPIDALYVADMTRKVIEHPDYLPEETRKRTDFESGKASGRIWRVRSKSSSRPSVGKSLGNELLKTAVQLGDQRKDNWIEELARLASASGADRWLRAAALSGLSGHELDFIHKLQKDAVTEKRDLPVDLLVESAAVLAAATPPAERQRILVELARDNTAQSAAAVVCILAGYARTAPSVLRESDDTAVQTVFASAARMAGSASEAESVRLAAIELLAASGSEAARAMLLEVTTPGLQPAAIRALAKLGDTTLLSADRWTKLSPTLRELILGGLLSRPAGQAAVLERIERGEFPAAAVDANRRRAFANHPDTTVRERAGKVFGAPAGDRGVAFERAKAVLALKADAKRGRGVFQQACATCHRLDREGAAVGPDLFGMANQPKETILLHIVVPDHELAPGFAAYACETKDGRTFAGVLASETPESVKLRMPGGVEETIRRAEVKELVALPTSLMPAGLEALGEQSLADLLAYLKGEK